MGVDVKTLDEVLEDSAAKQALASLDIDPEDNARLGDILDPNKNGSIDMHELISGLKRLRGDPKRSDIISVDLMIRAMQLENSEILSTISSQLEDISVELKFLSGTAAPLSGNEDLRHAGSGNKNK